MRRRGVVGTVSAVLTALFFLGVFLAVLSQFNGDLGALFQWFINASWNFVISVRDNIASWQTFQNLF